MGDTPQLELVELVEKAADERRVPGTAGGHDLQTHAVVIDLRDPRTGPSIGRLSADRAATWARLVDEDLSEEIHAEVGPSLLTLSAAAVHLLEVASILGPSFSVGDAAEVVGVPVGALLPVLKELLGTDLLVASGESLVFRQNALSEAVYARIPKPVRLALHRQIGRLLLARGCPADFAAPHLIIGAERGDVWALAGLERAARKVIRSSPHSAAAMALRAVELTDATDQQRLDRMATAVEAVLAAGRVREADELAAEALATPGVASVPAARLRLTRALIGFMQGKPEEAVAQAEGILAQHGLPQAFLTAAEVLCLYALAVQKDFVRARQAAEQTLSGIRSDSDGALAAALATFGFIAWEEGRVADGLSLFHAASERGDRGTAEARATHPRLGYAWILTALGDFPGAEGAVSSSRRDIDLLSDTLWAAAPPAFRGQMHLAAGRLDAAVADAESALALVADLGTRFFAPMAHLVLAMASLDRGDLATAATHLDAYRQEPSSGVVMAGAANGVWIEARVADAKGDHTLAAALTNTLLDECAQNKRLFVDHPASGPWLVRTALAAGERHKAELVSACLDRLAADNPRFPSVAASALHARGLLRSETCLLEDAAASHRHPWTRASALEDVGRVLATRGKGAEAGAWFDKALSDYEGAGATRDATRVRARLRDVGIRRRHWKRAERAAWGWNSLTETEYKVTALVAEGLTNLQVAERMFLSRHTIDFHLRQIFRKLGIASRVELTRMAMEHDPAGVGAAV